MSLPIQAPLKQFGLPAGDPWLILISEAERNTASAGRLPPMLIGYGSTHRLALTRTDLTPEAIAAVEASLLGRVDTEWTATAGEMLLQHGGGLLRHVFVRARWPEGRWRAAARPFLFSQTGHTWLGEWKSYTGDVPEGVFFPTPDERDVHFDL